MPIAKLRKKLRKKPVDEKDLDPRLFRHPKRRSSKVTETSREIYRKRKECGHLSEHRQRVLGWLQMYVEAKEPDDFTAPEAWEWIQGQGLIPPNATNGNKKSFIQREFAAFKFWGILTISQKRRCTAKESSKNADYEAYHLTDVVPGEKYKPLVLDKSLLEKVLKQVRRAYTALLIIELCKGKSVAEAEEALYPFWSLVEYVDFQFRSRVGLKRKV